MFLDIAIIIGATIGIYFFSELLSKGSDSIGSHYKINPSIRGATLDAVASSFPEFCTVIFALAAGSFEAGVGTIAGSALYNILVIPALSVFVVGKLKIQKEVVQRDGFLYLAVVVGLVLAIWLGPEQGGEGMHLIPMWVGLLAISIYAGYVALLIIQARQPKENDKRSSPREEEFVAWKVYSSVIIGMIGIGAATHFLVEHSIEVFRHFNFSEAIAGVTILAAATSLPDTLLSVFAAKRGDADGAVSNALGSNSFDILICLGAPILVTGGIAVNWATSWPTLIILLISTVISVFFLLTDLTLSRREGGFLFLLYLVFMALVFARII